VNTIPIESEAALLHLLEQDTTFRGQSNAAWKLESRLERNAVDLGVDLHELEISLIDEFINRCIRLELGDIYSPHKLPHRSNTFEWLSLMQHYGHPTRLIDFTDDVWVALHFALSGDNPSMPFSIYGLKMLPGDEVGNKLPKDSNGRVYRVSADGDAPNMNELLGLAINFRHFQSPCGTRRLGAEWSKPKQNYGWDAPAIRNVRIKRQKGRFLYQLLPDGRLEQIDLLTKFTVPAGLRSTARLMLDRLGPKYSAEYLFPAFEEMPLAQRGGAANGSQPFHSDADRTSPAVGSR